MKILHTASKHISDNKSIYGGATGGGVLGGFIGNSSENNNTVSGAGIGIMSGAAAGGAGRMLLKHMNNKSTPSTHKQDFNFEEPRTAGTRLLQPKDFKDYSKAKQDAWHSKFNPEGSYTFSYSNSTKSLYGE